MRPDHDTADYRGRRVTVMGLGSFGGGVGAVRFLVARGASVTISDLRTAGQLQESLAEIADLSLADLHLGEHRDEDFLTAELVVVNPAVPRHHPLLQRCREHGVPLTSEMNLFWQHNRGTILGITGSNGKSTTTALLASMLRHSGKRCWLGGNLGRSLLPDVEQIQPDDRVVLELSSFQLEDLNRLEVSPHVAVVTNFAANHLDWHGDVESYRFAKQSILRWQQPPDVTVLNADDPDASSWTTRGTRVFFGQQDRSGPGICIGDQATVYREEGHEHEVPIREWLALPGSHNLANACAAVAAARAVGTTWSAIEAGIRSYEPLPHRLQFVAEVDGRRYYNDSLATTPESAIVALAAFAEPIVLLAGGYDKRVDLTPFAEAIAECTKAVSLMGQTASALASAIAATPQRRTRSSPQHADFGAALAWAVAESAPGDVILLSPGCASYDWFRNFSDRGQQFIDFVRALQR